MRKIIASLAVLSLIVAGAVTGEEKHVKATLEPVDGSGVTGFVQMTQLPHGGTNVHVQVRGLEPGSVYTSFYYESLNCSEPADQLETFTADASGNGQASGKIDEDLDEVGTVSVRLGEGYGKLMACAAMHE